MSLRDAARAVVRASALSRPGDLAVCIERMARELSLTADRDQLSADINARRRTDDVIRMREFRATFDALLATYCERHDTASLAALHLHLFGAPVEPPKTYLL